MHKSYTCLCLISEACIIYTWSWILHQWIWGTQNTNISNTEKEDFYFLFRCVCQGCTKYFNSFKWPKSLQWKTPPNILGSVISCVLPHFPIGKVMHSRTCRVFHLMSISCIVKNFSSSTICPFLNPPPPPLLFVLIPSSTTITYISLSS